MFGVRGAGGGLDEARGDGVVGVVVVPGRAGVGGEPRAVEGGDGGFQGGRLRQGEIGVGRVGHPRGLVEELAWGDPGGAGVVGGELGELVADGRVEVDAAFLGEGGHRQRRHRLGEGGDRDRGPGGHRLSRRGVPVPGGEDDTVAPGHGDRRAGDSRTGQMVADEAVGGGPVEDRRLTRGGLARDRDEERRGGQQGGCGDPEKRTPSPGPEWGRGHAREPTGRRGPGAVVALGRKRWCGHYRPGGAGSVLSVHARANGLAGPGPSPSRLPRHALALACAGLSALRGGSRGADPGGAGGRAADGAGAAAARGGGRGAARCGPRRRCGRAGGAVAAAAGRPRPGGHGPPGAGRARCAGVAADPVAGPADLAGAGVHGGLHDGAVVDGPARPRLRPGPSGAVRDGAAGRSGRLALGGDRPGAAAAWRRTPSPAGPGRGRR